LSLDSEFLSTPAAIAASASLTALKLNASAIICLTTSGKTASMISSIRPKARIIAVTESLDVLNGLELIWGMQTLTIQPYKTIDDVLLQVDQLLVQFGLAKTGERVIYTLGQPMDSKAKTNSLFVHTVGAENFHRIADEMLPLRCQSKR